MDLTRRSVLKLFGGATAGAVLSPLPWKLLDDVSIWTQNWAWMARAPRGPVSYAHTTCGLCPAGCGLKLRRIGACPVSAWGVEGHPAGEGTICPIGLGAAEARFHPSRIAGAAMPGDGKWCLVDGNEAIGEVGRRLAAIRTAGKPERVALLDLRPGRSLSVLYREFLARAGGGRYLVHASGRDASAAAFAAMIEGSAGSPGFDFEHAAAVISFGAPLLDGWSGAGPAPALARRIREGRGAPFLVQVDAYASATASSSNRWLPIRPGTEAVLALGIAHVLLREGLADEDLRRRVLDLEEGDGPGYLDVVRRFPPARVASVTGIDADGVRATARELAAHRPAIAIGGGDPGAGPLGEEEEAALWGLNVLLGSVGRRGGVTLRANEAALFRGETSPVAESLRDVPDASLDLLFVDGSNPAAPLPADLLRRKIDAGGWIVGLSPYVAGGTAAADLVLPVAAAGEWTDDVTAPSLAARSTYSYSVRVTDAPEFATHPAEMLERVAAAAGIDAEPGSGEEKLGAVLRTRREALFTARRGEVFDPESGSTRQLVSLISVDQFERILLRGGCWIDREGEGLGDAKVRLLGRGRALAERFGRLGDGRLAAAGSPGDFPLVLALTGDMGAAGGALPPVINKIYRESHLKAVPRFACVHPSTARAAGLHDGRQASLRTERGAMTVTVVHDESVMPGVVRMASGPDPAGLGDPADRGGNVFELCGVAERPVWRVTPAALREV